MPVPYSHMASQMEMTTVSSYSQPSEEIPEGTPMCRNGEHPMVESNIAEIMRRGRNGKMGLIRACRTCQARRHHRYDNSWKGQMRVETQNERRRNVGR